MPRSCLGASLGFPGIWCALFQFEGFAVAYESGMNELPVFDACIEVFSNDKSVKVSYDTPYVKGLPVTMTVREKIPGRKCTSSSGFQQRVLRRTYEDAYTLEFEEFYRCVTHSLVPKTSIADARKDLEILQMILRAGENNYNNRP